jgi:hypothetical protein
MKAAAAKLVADESNAGLCLRYIKPSNLGRVRATRVGNETAAGAGVGDRFGYDSGRIETRAACENVGFVHDA